jgi:hypothetical protein
LDRLHIRVHLPWVSRWVRRLLVATGARCPLKKPAVAAVEQQAAIEPHCSRGVQPGGIYVHVVQREPAPGGPGSGLRPGRRRFLHRLPLWFYSVYRRSIEIKTEAPAGLPADLLTKTAAYKLAFSFYFYVAPVFVAFFLEKCESTGLQDRLQ